MPSRIDVTIFNASADEPDQDDAIVSLTGAAMSGGASAVTASEQSNSIAVDLEGVSMSGNAGNVAAVTQGSDTAYINSRNQWGGTFISGAVQTILNPASDLYIWGRCANFVEMNILNFCDGQRGGLSDDYNLVLQDNPLAFMTLHDTPMHGWTAYEVTNNRFNAWKYKFCVRRSRYEVLAYIDYGDRAEGINGPQTPASGFSRVSMMPDVTNPVVQDWWGDAMADLLMGTSYASDPNCNSNDGPDLSYRCGMFNDSTQIVSPHFNAKCQQIINFGVINSVVISNTRMRSCIVNPAGTQTITTQRIGDDFFAMNPSTVGFVGYIISGVSDNGNGTYTITFETLPSPAAATQDIIPQGGWDFCINNENSGSQALDWNKDGTTDSVLAGHWLWGAGWLATYDRIEARVLQETGHLTGRGANMLARSAFAWKDDEGWVYPHVFTQQVDYPSSESWSGSVNLGITHSDTVAGVYNIANIFDMTRMMRSIGFSVNWIKPPNEFMVDKCRGAQMEVEIAGPANYDGLGLIDFRRIEWHWAIFLNFMPKVLIRVHRRGGQYQVAIPHFWLDLDTNFSGVAPLGTYDEGGGDIGSIGPKGEWTWSTGQVGDLTDNGRRIYIRRYGNFLVIVNLGDVPGDYGNQITLSYAARDPEDIVTTSDWSDLISGGMISGGESLRYPDYDTYINPRLTTYLQAENPSYWGGFNYGPKQPHPTDAVASGTLATAEWMIDDPLYDGSFISTSSDFEIPVFQARVFEIL